MNKFHAQPTTTSDGIRHDSKAEAARWDALKLMERAGEISSLQRQVEFPLLVNGIQIGKYRADFCYVNWIGGQVIEDVKGIRTPLFNWKAKHMAAQGAPVTVYPPKKKAARCRKQGKSSRSGGSDTGSSLSTRRSRKPSKG